MAGIEKHISGKSDNCAAMTDNKVQSAWLVGVQGCGGGPGVRCWD